MTREENVAILDTMLELFGPDGEHWGQGKYAHDEDGDGVDYVPPKGCEVKIGEMCLMGAAALAWREVEGQWGYISSMVEALDGRRPPFYTALLEAIGAGSDLDVTSFNDRSDREFSEIKAAIIEAKESLLSNEGML